jgi:hypothetical protein
MPARFWKVGRASKALGIESFSRGGKGSHVVLMNAAGKTYPVSLHYGPKTEISDVYLRGICRFFGVDYDELKRNL